MKENKNNSDHNQRNNGRYALGRRRTRGRRGLRLARVAVLLPGVDGRGVVVRQDRDPGVARAAQDARVVEPLDGRVRRERGAAIVDGVRPSCHLGPANTPHIIFSIGQSTFISTQSILPPTPTPPFKKK